MQLEIQHSLSSVRTLRKARRWKAQSREPRRLLLLAARPSPLPWLSALGAGAGLTARHRVCDGLRNLFLRLGLLVCGPDIQMDGYFPATHEMKSRI